MASRGRSNNPHKIWYGYRAPAGRPAGPNPRVRHLSREDVGPQRTLRISLQLKKGLSSVRGARVRAELAQAFRSEGARERPGFRLLRMTLEKDRALLSVVADDARALHLGMSSVTIRFARTVNRALGRRGAVLADRYRILPEAKRAER